jgi:class 3 adenylate cyclase/pimeloyl-ACP methyl ester carboxylesterase
MEPRIQYAQTKDGVSIAFYQIGEGPPQVWMPLVPGSHLEMEWQIPQFRQGLNLLIRSNELVRYDSRGFGLSERDVTDFSVDAMVGDLEAVVDHLGLGKFQLLALGWQGPVAIAYAAHHPERLSHLVLQHATSRGSGVSEQFADLTALAEKDWEMASEAWAHALFGWSEGDFPRQLAALFRESANPDTLMTYVEQVLEHDVSDLLPQVIVPTLVAHRRQFPYAGVAVARELAAAIPNARLLLLEGSSFGMGSDGGAAIQAFLREGEEPAEGAQAGGLPEGMAVILFADIVESTALTEEMGDAAFREKARELDATVRAVIRECAGTPVEGKVLGDGVLAVFMSARQAIECALRCDAASEPAGLQLHLGIHAGDVIREGNNVYGGAVNIAARIAGASAPGEVLVSDTVRSLARTSAGVAFEDRGEQTLKGVADPQRLFAVRGGGR